MGILLRSKYAMPVPQVLKGQPIDFQRDGFLAEQDREKII